MVEIKLIDYTTGQTVYVFPVDQSLDDWNTFAVALVENTSPNIGRYVANVDPANGTQWLAFNGSSQPIDWRAALPGIGWDISTTKEGMKEGVRAGISGRWTNIGTDTNRDDISVGDIP